MAEVFCNFCHKKGLLPAPLETPSHVFFHCPTVNSLLVQFFQKYLRIDVDFESFFTGNFTDNDRFNKALTILMDVCRYCIWQFRLLKKQVNYYSFESEVTDLLRTITLVNKKIEQLILNCPLINADGDQQGGLQPGPGNGPPP